MVRRNPLSPLLVIRWRSWKQGDIAISGSIVEVCLRTTASSGGRRHRPGGSRSQRQRKLRATNQAVGEPQLVAQVTYRGLLDALQPSECRRATQWCNPITKDHWCSATTVDKTGMQPTPEMLFPDLTKCCGNPCWLRGLFRPPAQPSGSRSHP